MAQFADSSSNKVTVEYSDPSGIFSLLSSHLLARLPLRYLHWNSSSRPLRSIDSLHVELVPDNKRSSKVLYPSALTVGVGDAIIRVATPSVENALEGESAPGSAPLAPVGAVEASRDMGIEPRKERRHQIPGLRRTPYLKVYLLRCDDSETYKGSSRRLLREWVKEHTPASQSSASVNTQENHDAFEWLIVHVVVPDTPAAGQSRPSASVKSEDGTERSNSSSRWPGRSSSSILDKIRSDFNGTSKSAVDRVAQIQVTKIQMHDQATTNAPLPSATNSQGDPKVGWDDLVVKMKSLILASFDLRVRQYEEDIRARESQRNLPGWNFCTFFVLKEGLARGFESVGLIEDALMGYDELAVGVDLVIREQNTTQSGVAHGGLFLDYTPELFEQVKHALEEGQPSGINDHGEPDTTPKDREHSRVALGTFLLDTDRKPYRELILGNNISAFDFQCYVFARQVSLLLRLANVSPLNKASETRPSGGEQPEDLLTIAEVCRRATGFITSAARVVRQDVQRSLKHDPHLKETSDQITAKTYQNIVENIVASWIFSSTQQILQSTTVSSIPDIRRSEDLAAKPVSGVVSHEGRSHTLAIGPPSVRRDNLPTRTSSLSLGTTPVALLLNEDGPRSDSPFGPRLSMPTGLTQSGTEEAAAYKADLLLLGRRALSSVGSRHGWQTGWAEIATESLAINGDLDVVPLAESEVAETGKVIPGGSGEPSTDLAGLNDDTLHAALSNQAKFYAYYEDLTASALRQYHLGNRHKAAEALTADMAALRFFFADYAGAASYLQQMVPIYAEHSWSFLETTMLQMHAQCLKKLEKTEEYIYMALKILAKWVETRKEISIREARREFRRTTFDQTDHGLGDIDTKHYLDDLLLSSKVLKQQISISMDDYFGPISVDPYIRHYADKDGFQLLLRIQYLLPEAMHAQQVRLRIVSWGEGQKRDIWLAADEAQVMEAGTVKMMVGSNILMPGVYRVDKVEIISENISFHHDSLPTSTVLSQAASGTLVSMENTQPSFILVWPSPSALEARLSLCKSIHLEKPRSVEIKVSTGWNVITKGELLVRAGSAGLRLHTADAEIVDSRATIREKAQTGVVAFGEVAAVSDMTIRIPYRLESDLNEISMKIEISYSTPKGDFIYAFHPTISVVLPLGVNVQDIFKERAFFSRFTVNAATPIPLRLLECELEGSRDFAATSPPLGGAGVDVFGRQPASLLYRISRKQDGQGSQEEGLLQTKLSMQITYQCLDDEILTAVEATISAALKNSPFQDFSRLLVPALLANIRTRLTVNDLEVIGMLREVDVGPFDRLQWDRTLMGLRPELREKLIIWLTEWHEKLSLVLLPDAVDTERSRRITIPVEIPQMQVVHTAQLRMQLGSDETSQPALAAMGQVIPATLMLKHTRKWDMRVSSAHDDLLEFYYEIHANPEMWLVGGQKRRQFSVKEGEVSTFPLVLIPQRAGHLLYPTVEIRALSPQARGSPPPPQASRPVPPISCETDYLNQGETLLVVPNMSSVTASLDPGGPAGGAWLADSRPRVDTTPG